MSFWSSVYWQTHGWYHFFLYDVCSSTWKTKQDWIPLQLLCRLNYFALQIPFVSCFVFRRLVPMQLKICFVECIADLWLPRYRPKLVFYTIVFFHYSRYKTWEKQPRSIIHSAIYSAIWISGLLSSDSLNWLNSTSAYQSAGRSVTRLFHLRPPN